LRTPKDQRALLIEGLAQAESDCFIPKLHVKKSFTKFVTYDLPKLLPSTSIDNCSSGSIAGIGSASPRCFTLIAHPPLKEHCAASPNLNDEIKIAVNSMRFSKYANKMKSELISHGTLKSVEDAGADDSFRCSAEFGTLQHGKENDTKSYADLTNQTPQESRVVVAIGPEGGWEEQEVLCFQQLGFQLINLGDRILRTDVAVRVFYSGLKLLFY
jgi:hypothetical protein